MVTYAVDDVGRDGRAQDIVQPVVAFDLLHGRRVRQEDGVVLVLPGNGESLRLQRRHDLARQVSEADDRPDGVVHAEQLIPHGAADHADVGGPIHVVL
jgi:hypothetical protein